MNYFHVEIRRAANGVFEAVGVYKGNEVMFATLHPCLGDHHHILEAWIKVVADGVQFDIDDYTKRESAKRN